MKQTSKESRKGTNKERWKWGNKETNKQKRNEGNKERKKEGKISTPTYLCRRGQVTQAATGWTPRFDPGCRRGGDFFTP